VTGVQTCALPIFVVDEATVTECISVPDEIVNQNGATVVYRHRGTSLSSLHLGELFGLRRDDTHTSSRSVVIARSAFGPIGLVVDALHGTEQTVVKPLGPMFRDLPALAGASITGSGEVALVLEIERLVANVARPANVNHPQ
jgi:two-component system chemotaxis sensor kinase CheA